jgi:hypothetical protein
MNDFPSLDEFSVTEYGDVHMADPRVVNVLQVTGKAHIEYCYENDEMMCSIDSDPKDGMWRWMIIQRHPFIYMDDGNLGGIDSLMSAYEEAKKAYLEHRKLMSDLRKSLDNGSLAQAAEPVIALDSHKASPSEPQPIAEWDPYGNEPYWEYDGNPLQRPSQVATGQAQPMVATAMTDTYHPHDRVEQTPLAAFDEFDDALDRFFSQDPYDDAYGMPPNHQEHSNVDFGDGSTTVESSFDMDLDEFLGIDTNLGNPRRDRTDDAFSKMIESGLNLANARRGRNLRDNPE